MQVVRVGGGGDARSLRLLLQLQLAFQQHDLTLALDELLFKDNL